MSFEDALNCNLLNHIWEGSAQDFRRDILDWVSAQFTLPNKAVKAVGNIKDHAKLDQRYHLNITLP